MENTKEFMHGITREEIESLGFTFIDEDHYEFVLRKIRKDSSYLKLIRHQEVFCLYDIIEFITEDENDSEEINLVVFDRMSLYRIKDLIFLLKNNLRTKRYFTHVK